MTLSLRTRLTVWYSALLLLALVVFTATVLWLHWRLLVRQSDESLEALATTGANVVADELAEHATLGGAAREMADVVRHEHYDAFTNVVDVYIQRLRRKLDLPDAPSMIRTRRGQGYQLL